MTVYVDDMHLTAMGQYGRMKMCHMVADTDEELHAMAAKIGVARKWFQSAGTYKRHYDIAMSKRKLAVDNGAVEITMSQLGRMVRSRRLTGELHASQALRGSPGTSADPVPSAGGDGVGHGEADAQGREPA